jgi:hypothetical protein
MVTNAWSRTCFFLAAVRRRSLDYLQTRPDIDHAPFA